VAREVAGPAYVHLPCLIELVQPRAPACEEVAIATDDGCQAKARDRCEFK
jgi:hypothetical protein